MSATCWIIVAIRAPLQLHHPPSPSDRVDPSIHPSVGVSAPCGCDGRVVTEWSGAMGRAALLSSSWPSLPEQTPQLAHTRTPTPHLTHTQTHSPPRPWPALPTACDNERRAEREKPPSHLELVQSSDDDSSWKGNSSSHVALVSNSSLCSCSSKLGDTAIAQVRMK